MSLGTVSFNGSYGYQIIVFKMWRDIFLANSEEIKKLTNMFIDELKKFSEDLNSQNSKKLLIKLQKTKNIRNRIVKARQAGKFIPND